MDKKTAKKVVEKIFESPSHNIKIEFQGGEPLLNFEIIKYIIEKAEWINLLQKRNLEFVICTNLTSINEKMLKWLRGHRIYISTSIDGPKELHNLNRPLYNIENSYDLVIEKINLCREYLGQDSVSALMTPLLPRDCIAWKKDNCNLYVPHDAIERQSGFCLN